MGLPCAHQVQQAVIAGQPLAMDTFHAHWRLNRLTDLPNRGEFADLQDPRIQRTRGAHRPGREPSFVDIQEAEMDDERRLAIAAATAMAMNVLN